MFSVGLGVVVVDRIYSLSSIKIIMSMQCLILYYYYYYYFISGNSTESTRQKKYCSIIQCKKRNKKSKKKKTDQYLTDNRILPEREWEEDNLFNPTPEHKTKPNMFVCVCLPPQQ